MARVLVVDDEEGIRRTTGFFLQGAGHQVQTAASVAEARGMLGEDAFDVVMSDIIMPGEDGLQLLAAVRDWNPRVQVILFTGEPTLETATEALRQGAFDYLPKPVRKDAVVSSVERAARAKAVLDENARLAEENERYQTTLEDLVETRTALLAQSEKRFRIAAECASDVIYERDVGTGMATFFGPADERLGYETGGFPRSFEGWRDSLHPDDRPRVMTTLKALMRDGSQYSNEYRLRRKDGYYEHCRDSGTLVRDSKGVPRRAIGAVTIVTSEVQARQALDAMVQQLSTALRGTIRAIATAVESRDRYTAGHHRRVAALSAAMARELGLSADVIEGVEMSAAVHDVGKISVSADILMKPGKLSANEYGLVKQHCAAGHAIFEGLALPWPVAEVILQHHERVDGSGYPAGLKGDSTLLEARIIAVADVVEAMASHRPYRPALGIDAALDEVERNSGRLYDAEVARVCVGLFRARGYRMIE